MPTFYAKQSTTLFLITRQTLTTKQVIAFHTFSPLAVMRAYSLCQLRYYPKVMGPSMIEETYRAGATLADISTVV